MRMRCAADPKIDRRFIFDVYCDGARSPRPDIIEETLKRFNAYPASYEAANKENPLENYYWSATQEEADLLHDTLGIDGDVYGVPLVVQG